MHTFVLPAVAFLHPAAVPTDEDTPVGDVPAHLPSALAAERAVQRFAEAGGRGVILRLWLLNGLGTGFERPHHRLGAGAVALSMTSPNPTLRTG